MKKEYDLFLSWDNSKNEEIFSCIDNEAYFRLNPHWTITSLSSAENGYLIEIVDSVTGQAASMQTTVTRESAGFPVITADITFWESISFGERNGSLYAEVAYDAAPTDEVEKQIVFWLRSIKEYFRLYATNSINTRFFRMLMNRIILKMTPSQRKISLMLIRITILEVVVMVLILVGWFFLN